MDLSRLVSVVQISGCCDDVMALRIFSWKTLGPLVPIKDWLNATD